MNMEAACQGESNVFKGDSDSQPPVTLCAVIVNSPPQASTVRSTLRRLAFFANRAACFEFLDMIGRERNPARPDQVDGDLADAVGRIDSELVERFDVAGDGDDETVHHVFDAIGLLVDRLRHALQERLDLGKVEVRVRLNGDHAAVSLPAGRGDGFILGFDPL